MLHGQACANLAFKYLYCNNANFLSLECVSSMHILGGKNLHAVALKSIECRQIERDSIECQKIERRSTIFS